MKQYSRADFLRTFSGATANDLSAASSNQSPVNKFANHSRSSYNPTSPTGISPYTGTWGQAQIMHLLRRTLFGVSQADYNHFSTMSLTDCVNALLTLAPTPSPPVNVYNDSNYTDPNVAPGATWVTAAYTDGTANSRRIENLKEWWVGLMLNQDRSLTEKMTLFWHNHFATQMKIVNDARYSYKHIALLRASAFGNFQTLTRAITTDPNMLVYLNGNTNTVGAPNENYGRELQELFTVGKGFTDQAPYTEGDVEAAAKVLTGWDDNSTSIDSKFTAKNHDTTDKQFSSFYDNTIINGQTGANGANETDELINMIFNSSQSQQEVAKFLCRNLYRWFIYYNIDINVEINVISPLAQVVINNNFEIAPVLQTLLTSEHFFDPLNMGCHIKNPVDHVVGVCRQFNVPFPIPSSPTDITGLTNQYGAWGVIDYFLATMALDPGDPPNVAGWPAYYEEPQFNELWINSDTLPLRNELTDALSSTTGVKLNGINFQTDLLAFTTQFSNPADPNQLITDSTALLSANAFDATETAFLLSILLSGQTQTYYWTDAWNAYVADPSNATNKSVVQTRLFQYYAYVMERAEYQLI